MRLTLPLAAFAVFAAIAPVAAQTAAPVVPSAPTTDRASVHVKRPRISMDTRFQTANTTHDGHLTLEQAHASDLMHVVSKNFEAIDKDHRGFVTEDDIRGWYKARREARKLAREREAAGKG